MDGLTRFDRFWGRCCACWPFWCCRTRFLPMEILCSAWRGGGCCWESIGPICLRLRRCLSSCLQLWFVRKRCTRVSSISVFVRSLFLTVFLCFRQFQRHVARTSRVAWRSNVASRACALRHLFGARHFSCAFHTLHRLVDGARFFCSVSFVLCV